MTACRAPGKLILSGEHAVVHGCPALVMAVNRYVTATIQPTSESDTVTLSAPEVLGSGQCRWAELPALKQRLDSRFQAFLDGTLPIQEVTEDDVNLVYYGLALLLEDGLIKPDHGIALNMNSDVPVGCGMGSSAALMAAVFAAATGHWDVKATRAALYEWTLATERLQHGHPSGVDPYITVHGGLVRFQRGTARPLNTASVGVPIRLVLTGTPQSTTGECVEWVRQQHGQDKDLWDAFTATTEAVADGWTAGDADALGAAIRENHRLLTRIGVVPERVQAFVSAVEESGGAAKICGAGSVRGEAAGVVLVVGSATAATVGRANRPGEPGFDLAACCDPFGYREIAITLDEAGVAPNS